MKPKKRAFQANPTANTQNEEGNAYSQGKFGSAVPFWTTLWRLAGVAGCARVGTNFCKKGGITDLGGPTHNTHYMQYASEPCVVLAVK